MKARGNHILRVLVLMLLVLVPDAFHTAGVAADSSTCGSDGSCTIIPYLSTGYRYQVVAHGAGAGFEQPGFNDAGWPLGNAGFGANLSCGVHAKTNWPLNTDILVRKHFTLPPGAADLQVGVSIDNDVQVFINGIDISGGLQVHEGCATPDNLVFAAPNTVLLFGDNVIAIRGRDRGVDDYLDVRITVREAGAPHFSDGFESGNFSAWSSVQTNAGGAAVVENYLVSSGQFAARLSATTDAGSYAYARKTLAAPQTDLTVSGDFNVRAQGASMSTVPLFRLFDGAGNLVVSLYRLNLTNGEIWVQHSGTYHRTTGMLPLKTWGHLALHLITAGANRSTVEVLLNGTTIYAVQGASLGTAGVQTVQIGNEAHQQVFDLVVDNIVVQ
jgi:hypothetical protein